MGEERRVLPRYRTDRSARITVADGSTIDCQAFDLSTGGAGLVVQNQKAIPEAFVLTIERMGVRHRCRVVWRSGKKLGVAFQ